MKALDMAIKRRCPGAGLMHHSDQGSTDASEDYQKILAAHGITCSMSREHEELLLLGDERGEVRWAGREQWA